MVSKIQVYDLNISNNSQCGILGCDTVVLWVDTEISKEMSASIFRDKEKFLQFIGRWSLRSKGGIRKWRTEIVNGKVALFRVSISLSLPLHLSDQPPMMCIYNWANFLSYKLQPWRQVQHIPLKNWNPCIRLHGAIIQKITSCLKILWKMIQFMCHHWQSISFFFLKKKVSTSFSFTH